MNKPKEKVFKDTSGDRLYIKTRTCHKGRTEKLINVVDIGLFDEHDDQVEFESPSKVRRIATKLNQIADWMEQKL
jgi:hypothetical protein